MYSNEATFTIGQAAAILGVPAATLRFWEDQGLVRIRKSKNRYRSYTTRDLIQIADVMFLRSLGVPVGQVQQMNESSLEDYTRQLAVLQQQLEEKIRSYHMMHRHAQVLAENLKEVQRLRQHFGCEEPVPFSAVEPFDFMEPDKLRRYMKNPSSYVRCLDSRNPTAETRCIIAGGATPPEQLYWRRSKSSRFVTFLIRENVDRDYESDVSESLERLRQNHCIGMVLAQYLVTASEDGKHIDFLKGFAEILED